MPMQSAKQLTGNMETGTMGHGLFGTIGIAKELVKSASFIIIAIHEKRRQHSRLLFYCCRSAAFARIYTATSL